MRPRLFAVAATLLLICLDASYGDEINARARDSLSVAVQDRIGNLKIQGEPVPASVIRNLANAITKLLHRDEQLTALQNLGRFCDVVRSGQRRDVGWGLVVAETQDFVRLQLAQSNSQDRDVSPALRASPAPPADKVQLSRDVPLEIDMPEPLSTPSPNIWEDVKQRLITKLTGSAYQHWIAGTTLDSSENGQLSVRVPDPATAEWIEGEYAAQIQDALQELNGPVHKVQYVVTSSPKRLALKVTCISA